MTFQELKRLVSQGESETLEFKRKVAHPEKIIKEIVAFANTKGGKLLIGVSDDGTIPGVKFPEDEIYALNHTIEKMCKPLPDFEITHVAINEKNTALVYDIPVSSKRPLHVKEDTDSKWGQVYVRFADKSIKASREVREIIKRQKRNKDIKFNFGEKEKVLMSYLEEHKTINLYQFQKVAKLNKYTASNTLIILVLANVLSVEPYDKGDIYRLKNKF
ncbi:AlbA family DNA-binding domain-containing protein [Fulvivirga lutimaris]|uniref:AlbA family DNA-binding domain-containing protein n=1 Tax=Fulvivirga lutimaris TaxID=1819566 RepID=UPI0012BBCB34|nr:RNA-binding domain-containing protein [Fulvivirga lutimaris]MTI40720.1 ATP-binding protein [Fulvivirga lutimaris]